MNLKTVRGKRGVYALALSFLFSLEAGAAIHYVNASGSSPLSPYTDWNTAATNIQEAVDAASGGDQILVTNGIYDTGGRVLGGALTNRVAVDKALTIQSVNGPLVTVIKGNSPMSPSAVRCIYLTNDAVLVGFTLTNGATLVSAGIDSSGGGALCSISSVLSNCVITGNSCGLNGGGVAGGVLYNCILSGNYSYRAFGGGAYSSTLNGCQITGNWANNGGGADSSILNDCLVISNSASTLGGGTHNCSLVGSTLVGNQANGGQGASGGTLANCISYYNYGFSQANYSAATLNYCCTTPLPAGGAGNITNAPLFVNIAGGDFRLQNNSPCINAGKNSYVTTSTDLGGNSRIRGGTVDMGAYEFQSPGSLLSHAWAQQYGLATDGSADHADADQDGMDNWQEWVAGTNPTNSLSVLKVLSLSNSSPGVKLTWQSVTNRSYYIQRATNLAMDISFSTIYSNVPGLAGSTSVIDTNAPPCASGFYRVGVQ